MENKFHAKRDADTLFDFATHYKKIETKSKEHLCINNTCLQRGATYQSEATDLWKCDLGLPWSSYKYISQGTFGYLLLDNVWYNEYRVSRAHNT
jgi:hypothetical protein